MKDNLKIKMKIMDKIKEITIEKDLEKGFDYIKITIKEVS